MRIVRSGEVVRVPTELPHRIENIGELPLRLDWLSDPGTSPRIAPSQAPTLI
jgi:mannose-6-phosphate isomerase-like protein (cupin superfamily)